MVVVRLSHYEREGGHCPFREPGSGPNRYGDHILGRRIRKGSIADLPRLVLDAISKSLKAQQDRHGLLVGLGFAPQIDRIRFTPSFVEFD